jgi:SAM-dependent methyltransferase
MRKALAEIKRVLKEDGRIILADNNPFFGPGWLKKRWKKELEMTGVSDINFSRYAFFTIIEAKNRSQEENS